MIPVQLRLIAALGGALSMTASYKAPPRIYYDLSINPADPSSIHVHLQIEGGPRSVRIAMAVHPEYNDRFWRYIRDLRADGFDKRAVLAAEDDLFWQHDGVDFEQLQASLEADWNRGRFARGGSTITQQLAKNLYLSPSKNPLRKLRELLIARRLEAELKKSRILELYLNVIEWGDGVYGVEGAARTYFHVSAADLGPSESALLAAAIVNPRLLNPGRPPPRLIRRQQLILRRMGAVTPPPETPQLAR